MADQPKAEADEAGRREALLARREARRRTIRRRRLLAAGALVLVAAIAAATLLLSTDSGRVRTSSHIGRQNANSAGAGEAGGTAEASSGLVRNASPQSDWVPHTGPVPILEYHVLGRPKGEVPYPELYVGRGDFTKQMDWLEEQGYQAVTLEAVENAWYHGGTLPAKPVVISFDDGYRPQYTFALPELRKHGWPGLLNLKAAGSELYESNVKAMIAAGWELAAHTIHHLDLTELDAAQLKEEVAGSRAILRREYGVPVKNFCYPAGQFDETVVRAVEEAGYVGATTEVPGFATKDHPYELARIEVLGNFGVKGLVEAMRSAAGEAAG
jgi:peptidoglycan/xylan/chitin deacetylase (PgdA/CDA1 family)